MKQMSAEEILRLLIGRKREGEWRELRKEGMQWDAYAIYEALASIEQTDRIDIHVLQDMFDPKIVRIPMNTFAKMPKGRKRILRSKALGKSEEGDVYERED